MEISMYSLIQKNYNGQDAFFVVKTSRLSGVEYSFSKFTILASGRFIGGYEQRAGFGHPSRLFETASGVRYFVFADASATNPLFGTGE